MTSKIREDLVVPYKHIPAKPRSEASAMISQSLPMAAMFMRNKMLSWASFFLAVQSFLNEPANKPEGSDQQPPILRVLFSMVSLGTCYMDLIFPSSNPALRRAAKVATDTVSETATAKA